MAIKIFFEQEPQEAFNIIEALQFYKDNAVMPKHKEIIDKQIDSIVSQLQIQNIGIYKNEKESRLKLGESYTYNDNNCIVIGMSDDEGFVKIAVTESVLEVPAVLLKKEEEDC